MHEDTPAIPTERDELVGAVRERKLPRSAVSSKPAKPYPDVPLFPHATGRRAKKINGRFAFFGP